jgi:hypothetical protein
MRREKTQITKLETKKGRPQGTPRKYKEPLGIISKICTQIN